MKTFALLLTLITIQACGPNPTESEFHNNRVDESGSYNLVFSSDKYYGQDLDPGLGVKYAMLEKADGSFRPVARKEYRKLNPADHHVAEMSFRADCYETTRNVGGGSYFYRKRRVPTARGQDQHAAQNFPHRSSMGLPFHVAPGAAPGKGISAGR